MSMPTLTRLRPPWLEVLGHRKERIAKYRWPVRISVLGLFLLGCLLIVYLQSSSNQHVIEHRRSSRHLLSTEADATTGPATPENCSIYEYSNPNVSHGLEWETCDFEKANVPEAWVFFHCVSILIIFVAIAIICDDFFVPSLEVISEKLHLSEDVAGATFMAAGSSAPELFTSVAGVTAENDIGVGTIVGSAVFNILIIIALTAALAGQVLELDWRPMARDSIFYALSIACFVGFAWDGEFEIWEAVILLVLYALYIVIMVFNSKIMDWMGTWKDGCRKKKVEPAPEANNVEPSGTSSRRGSEDELEKRKMSMTGGHARRLSIISHRSLHADGSTGSTGEKHIFHHTRQGSISGSFAINTDSLHAYQPQGGTITEDQEEEQETKPVEETKEEEKEDGEEERPTLEICPCCIPLRVRPPNKEEAQEKGKWCTKEGCWPWTSLVIKWILFVISFPFICLYTWTIPDCSKPKNRKCFLLSFIMSVVWIILLSFGMVALVGRAGCILKIDSYTMGLVIVAIGTSVPDALSSILVARDGYGDMAVSNAIGSNVFDINLGLGLPFIIRIAISGPITLISQKHKCLLDQNPYMIVPHAKFGFILVFLLVLALLIFGASRFRLNKYIGVSFVILYGGFLCYAFVQEFYCDQVYC